MIGFFILTFISFIFVGIIIYTTRFFTFTGNPIAQIIFHVLVQIDGASPMFIKGIALYCVVAPLFIAAILTIIFYNKKLIEKLNNIKVYSFIKKHSIKFALGLFVITFIACSAKLELVDYINIYTESSTLYEDEYVDPRNVEIEFPEKKRNLVYIFLESMETTYYSKEEGGAFDENVIPELYKLANENTTFNNNKGFDVATNASWTLSAMVAQHSATPVTIPIGENDFVTSNKFMPGLTSIGDILEKENYHNVLLLGSKAYFGGRQYFFEKHGNYDIHDYDYFYNNGKIDYEVWWGYEDFKLIEFAKEELLELSKKEEPFNLTMLTVDTHHPDGYICKYCEDKYDKDIKNVFACSSKQIGAFVDWIKEQDFYENTTIVIAGDHHSMSTTIGDLTEGVDRNVYYTIINPACEKETNKERELSTVDMFPTTIAALGAKIEGNKLGFGVNLFSSVETECEKDKGYFFSKLDNHSSWYDRHILYGFDD